MFFLEYNKIPFIIITKILKSTKLLRKLIRACMKWLDR